LGLEEEAEEEKKTKRKKERKKRKKSVFTPRATVSLKLYLSYSGNLLKARGNADSAGFSALQHCFPWNKYFPSLRVRLAFAVCAVSEIKQARKHNG
jgi:hypothetical protein